MVLHVELTDCKVQNIKRNVRHAAKVYVRYDSSYRPLVYLHEADVDLRGFFFTFHFTRYCLSDQSTVQTAALHGEVRRPAIST